MAQKTKIGKHLTPTKGNLGYFWTHGHNSTADWALEICSNPLKMRKVLWFAIKKIF